MNAIVRSALLVGPLLLLASAFAAEPPTADPRINSDGIADDAWSRNLTVTVQKMDIAVLPVGQRFDVQLSVRRDPWNIVTVDIPTISQPFASSQYSPNFSRSMPFPTLLYRSFPGQDLSAYSYPILDADYPLGGYIDTVANAIPTQYRPTGGLPVTFVVGSKATPGLSYRGSIDNQGRLQFSALDGGPIGVGRFVTQPTRVTYAIGRVPKVTLNNFKISPGSSNAAKWNPDSFVNPDQSTSIHWDYGDWGEDTLRGFVNGTYYRTWTDNSSALRYNTKDQPFKSYAFAKIDVTDFGKQFFVEKIVNLSREPGGDTLPPNFTYGEGGLAVDPTNPQNLAVDYQQRKQSRIGFLLSRSFDGGETWTKKVIGLPAADPNDPTCGWLNHVPDPSCKPLDPNLPIGGDDVRVGYDRFGGLWLTYLTGQLTSPTTFFAGPVYLVYSADKGETFTLILNEGTTMTSVPPNIQPYYQGFDYDNLGIGPDATDLQNDTVWLSVGQAIAGCAPNEYGQQFWGFRVKGLGVSNIDLSCPATPDGQGCQHGSLKAYSLPSSRQAGFSSIDLTPKGALVISLMQTNPQGTFLEQVQDNTRSWINVLEHGLADDKFSETRQYALTANGDCQAFPPTPHNAFLRPGTSLIAIDRSSLHPGRIYAVYLNRPGLFSYANKPYLTWSDDLGMTWSNPVNVSTDESSATAILATVSVDPSTGVVAVSWGDARGSPTDTEVNRFGVFLDPRELQ